MSVIVQICWRVGKEGVVCGSLRALFGVRLGLTLSQKGMIDGTVSTLVSIAAGIAAGKFIEKSGGLKKNLFLLALCMNVPHLCYIYMSQAVSPDRALPLWSIYLLVSIEKFGYGFGMVGNMLYIMQQVAPGRYKMTHYAFATALMNIVLFPTKALSGPLADWLGYRTFFAVVMLASIPSIWVAWKAPFPRAIAGDDESEEGAAASARA